MNTKLLPVLLLLVAGSAAAQNGLADSLRAVGKLDLAIKEYTSAFENDRSYHDNTYALASAYALTHYQKDKAFYYLQFALETDSSLWVLADPDMIALSDDPRWQDIEKRQLANYQAANGTLEDPDYAAELLQLIMKDQALDYQVDLARSYYMEHGTFPHWYYPIAEMKADIAQDNFKHMQDLIDRFGWPKYSTVGQLAADAPLLVINHHESDSVREYYLEVIREHCLSGEGSCMEFAKIHDRILVNKGQPQTYGMQFRFASDRTLEPFPIKDPEYVDRRRAEIGLEPLQNYLRRRIDYNWTVEQK